MGAYQVMKKINRIILMQDEMHIKDQTLNIAKIAKVVIVLDLITTIKK